MRSHWEEQAHNWLGWARTPDHDSYWWYRDAFFDLLPPPGRLTLDVGCGEGRVTRDVADRGHNAVGVDASPTLIKHAADAHPRGRYVRADAARLPLSDETVDLVTAYCSLMDFDEMPAAVQEAARVLVDGGRFCFCVTHPVADAGRFESREADARFTISDTYFGPRPFEPMTARRDGLEMTFAGWCHSIEEYSLALEAAGLVVEAIREPLPSAGLPEKDDGWSTRWTRLPQFLLVRSVKTPVSP